MLSRLIEPVVGQQTFTSTTSEISKDETAKPVSINPLPLVDYSSLFGEEFRIPDDELHTSYFNILDARAVEEGILHVLYACASQVKCNIFNLMLLEGFLLLVMSSIYLLYFSPAILCCCRFT